MAPETLMQYPKFTTMSDVWSFGVTFWEIFSDATTPYPFIDDFDGIFSQITNYQNWIVDSDNSSTRLPLDIPQKCPPSLRNVFRMCWKHNPNERCGFETIVSILREACNNPPPLPPFPLTNPPPSTSVEELSSDNESIYEPLYTSAHSVSLKF